MTNNDSCVKFQCIIDEHFHMIVSPLDLDYNTRQIVPYKLGSDSFWICRPFSVQQLNLMPSPVPSLF